jgi:hypothetical protein
MGYFLVNKELSVFEIEIWDHSRVDEDTLIGHVTIKRPSTDDWYRRKGGVLTLDNSPGKLEVFVTMINLMDSEVWGMSKEFLQEHAASGDREEIERKTLPNVLCSRSEILTVEVITSEGFHKQGKLFPYVSVSFPTHSRTIFPNEQFTDSVKGTRVPEWNRKLFFLMLTTHPKEMLVRLHSRKTFSKKKGLIGNAKIEISDDFEVHRQKYNLEEGGWIELVSRKVPCAAFFRTPAAQAYLGSGESVSVGEKTRSELEHRESPLHIQ